MRSYDELERLWEAGPRPPRDRGQVRLICVRTGGGAHQIPLAVEVTVDGGVAGDRWNQAAAPDPSHQITLMNARVAELVCGANQPLHMPGDNFLVDLDLGPDALPAGSRLRLGAALLEVSAAPHTGCDKFRARFGSDALRWVSGRAHRGERLRGIHCRVAESGRVAVGDAIEVVHRAAGDTP